MQVIAPTNFQASCFGRRLKVSAHGVRRRGLWCNGAILRMESYGRDKNFVELDVVVGRGVLGAGHIM